MAALLQPGKGVLAYFTRHRTLSNLIMVIALVAGLVATTRIRTQYFPDVVIAEVSVAVAWSGAGADDVDRGIVQVLEPALLAVDGVTDVQSRATEGQALISLEFEPGHDLGQATEDVQTAVDSVADLPDAAEDPVVRRGSWRDQVTEVVITGPVSVAQQGLLADELMARLFAAGVTRVNIKGVVAPETVIEVPSASLIRHDVTMADIAGAVAAAVRTAPAGEVGGGASRVRAGTETRSPAAIAGIVLRSAPDGTALTIGDVATLRVDGIDRNQASFVGRNPAMVLVVERAQDGDAIRLQATVADVVADFRQNLPNGVTVDLERARADQISARLNLLLDNGAMGLGLVLMLLFLFLNARTALWVAAGIPISMLTAVALMYAFGVTLNMISLFALIITLGVVVDDAIVVGEHADFRARHLGESPVLAAENAAKRMAAPVVASTLTTIIAFLGLVVIGGRFGDLIADIPFTVIAVLSASLLECFFILPHHMSHALSAAGRKRWYDAPSRVVNRGFDRVVLHWVRPAVGVIIHARYLMIALAVLALAWQAALFLRGDVQFRFFVAPEQSQVSGNFAMLPGAARDDTRAMLTELQRAAAAVAARYEAEHGLNPVTFAVAELGGGAGRGLAGADTKDADQMGAVSMDLVSPDARSYSTADFVADLQDEVRPHPQLEELSFRAGRFGPGGDAISVQLYGAESQVLKAAAEAVKTALAGYSEVSALEDSLAYDKEELILNLTPQGQALGFSTDGLGAALRDRLNGIEAATYPDGPRSASIRVEVPEGELTADFLESLLLRADNGIYVPLADIVTVESRSGFSTVRRENGLRVVTVSGDLAEDDPARATEIQRILADEILPRVTQDFGVAVQQGGLAQQERDFLGDAQVGLIVGLIGIYLTLAWIFASWTRPMVVMSVIPFGMIGAIYGHYIWGLPMSLFSIVGMIGMTGIIVNDSIVLVSTIDEYAEKRGLMPAIVDAIADRLRPVMLTTLTTVLGLAPLLYEGSSEAEFLKPTVVTLVYGLGFGMVLVLLLVPAVVAVQGDLARQITALRRMVRRGGRLRFVLWAAAGLVGVLFAATLGLAFGGDTPGWMAALWPGLAAMPAMTAALALFSVGAAAVTVLAYVAGLLLARGTRASGR